MKYAKLILVLFLLVGLAAMAHAEPIRNIAGDNVEDRSDNSIFGYYQNSGTLLFTQMGNEEGDPQYLALQAKMQHEFSVILERTWNTSFTNYDINGNVATEATNSGTWETIPPLGPDGTIAFYSVKAGNYFAVYRVIPASATGSWSTFDIWSIGGQGTGGNSLEVSHFIGYNPTAVPEPATMLLLGFGLIGLAVAGRRNLRK